MGVCSQVRKEAGKLWQYDQQHGDENCASGTDWSVKWRHLDTWHQRMNNMPRAAAVPKYWHVPVEVVLPVIDLGSYYVSMVLMRLLKRENGVSNGALL